MFPGISWEIEVVILSYRSYESSDDQLIAMYAWFASLYLSHGSYDRHGSYGSRIT